MRYYDIVMDSSRWEGFPFRPDDVVISTPPKCGTTWTQRLCSLVLGVEPTDERPMAVISPWLDMLTRRRDDVVADLERQEHRRFIKTHTPLDGLPWHDTVTYLVVARDPRDVAFSWADHMANLDVDRMIEARAAAVGLDDLPELLGDGGTPEPTEPTARFLHWVEHGEKASGLARLIHHVETFWEVRDRPNVHLFHYGDLLEDLPTQVRRIGATLGVDLDEEEVARIAAAARFDSMRADAERLVPNRDTGLWKDNASFFRNGNRRTWRDVLSSDDLATYDAAVAARTDDDDLVHWLHEGGPVSAAAVASPDP